MHITDDLLVSLLHPDDRPLSGPARLGRDNPLTYAEYRIIRPDSGEERWIARRGEVVDGDAQGRRRFVGVAFDITERKLCGRRPARLRSSTGPARRSRLSTISARSCRWSRMPGSRSRARSLA